MSYKVIAAFDDLQDVTAVRGGHRYHHYDAGDTYPRAGMTVSEARIAELSGTDNLRQTALIEAIAGSTEKPAEKKEAVKRTRKKKAEA